MSGKAKKTGRNDDCPCGSGRKFKHCHGRNAQSSMENTSSVSINYETKRTVFVTKDVLLNQLFRDGPIIARSFDQIAKEDLREISEMVASSVSLICHFVVGDRADYRVTCAGLLSSALSTFMASVEVARHGYRRPYGAIARGIVETLSTILHIASDPAAFSSFNEGKLNSTKSISAARRLFPPFGNLYGMFSNHFVHITRMHAEFEPIIKFERNEEALGFILSSLRANAWLIYVVAELIFYDQIESPRYWKKEGSSAYSYWPSEKEMLWMQKYLRDVSV